VQHIGEFGRVRMKIKHLYPCFVTRNPRVFRENENKM